MVIAMTSQTPLSSSTTRIVPWLSDVVTGRASWRSPESYPSVRTMTARPDSAPSPAHAARRDPVRPILRPCRPAHVLAPLSLGLLALLVLLAPRPATEAAERIDTKAIQDAREALVRGPSLDLLRRLGSGRPEGPPRRGGGARPAPGGQPARPCATCSGRRRARPRPSSGRRRSRRPTERPSGSRAAAAARRAA